MLFATEMITSYVPICLKLKVPEIWQKIVVRLAARIILKSTVCMFFIPVFHSV